jgi:putative MATE family efflux protein
VLRTWIRGGHTQLHGGSKLNDRPDINSSAGANTAAGTLRALLRLTWPVMLEQLLIMLVVLSDKWFTGNYLPGADYLAAITLVSYALGFVPSGFAAVAIGATAMVARFVGSGDEDAARRVANQAFTLGTLLVIAASGLGLLFGRQLIAGLSPDANTAALAERYLVILLFAFPAIMLGQVGNASLRGAGDTVTGLVAMALANIVNVVLGFGFVTGWGPFPKLGWSGLAIAASAGYCTHGAIVLARLLVGQKGLRIRLRLLWPELDLIRRILRIGIPGGVDLLAASACQFWFLSIVTRLGAVDAAAFGVAIAIEALAFMPGSAFQVAATTLAGQYLGAHDVRRAVRSTWLAAAACGGLMSLIAVGFYFGSEWLAVQFVGSGQGSGQEAIAERAAMLVRIVAFGQLPQALIMVFSGALRGVGDTRWTLVATFIGYLGVRLPLAYALAWSAVELHLGGWQVVIPAVGLGIRGAWYAMLADMTVRSLLVAGRFIQGGWKRIQV